MMENVEKELKPLLLQNVKFEVEDKILKEGVIKIFNNKQFFIKFKLETENGIKEYELPYPYRVFKDDKTIVFDYCLSSIIPRTEEIYWKMLLMKTETSSKYHNKYLKS